MTMTYTMVFNRLSAIKFALELLIKSLFFVQTPSMVIENIDIPIDMVKGILEESLKAYDHETIKGNIPFERIHRK